MKRSPLLPIFLVVLVDVLGFTIVYPLLPFYAEKFGATPLIATTLVSVYALCSLLSTPVIGRLSDQFGRRRLLLISQAGTCAGFIVLGFSEALWMVFLGRILDGLTAGNLSTAQAYISDHTRPENRAKAFGIIGIPFGIGFFFGPALAGSLQHYGLHVPFLVAAGMSLASMVCTYTLLEPGLPAKPTDESAASAPGGKRPAVFDLSLEPGLPAKRADGSAAAAPGDKRPAVFDPSLEPGLPAKLVDGSAAAAPGGKRPAVFDPSVYGAFFRRPGLGSLYLQFFLFAFAFSAFMSGFALFAERRFTSDGHFWTGQEVGYLFAYSGFLGIVLQGGLMGRLVKRFGERRLAFAGFVSIMVAYVVLGFTAALPLLIAVTTVSAFGNGVLRPVLTSEITQRVSRHEQGVAIGISGSLSSLAMTLAPPVGGILLDHAIAGPLQLIDQRWLLAWTLVPATAATMGLAAALVSRRSILRATDTPAAAPTVGDAADAG